MGQRKNRRRSRREAPPPAVRDVRSQRRTRARLEELYREFCLEGRDAHVARDPCCFSHHWPSPEDREVVAFLSSCFAYGNATQILASLRDLWVRLERLAPGKGPHRAVTAYAPSLHRTLLEGFRHRWHGPEELSGLLLVLQELLARWQSLGGFFRAHHRPGESTIVPALEAFCIEARRIAARCGVGDPGVLLFFPLPGRSACKRLNMFLRWMVRPAHEGIDLELWDFISPAALRIPLDTHVSRLSVELGLTRLRTAGWAMVEEVSGTLRLLDPHDPLKYDFALAHLGMSRRTARPQASRNGRRGHASAGGGERS